MTRTVRPPLRSARPAPALAPALALLLALAWAGRADACSVCACGDPLAAVAEGHGARGSLRLGLEAEALWQKAGVEGEPGVQDVLDQWTLRLTAVYSPTERLNLVAVLPVTRKHLRVEQAGFPTVTSSDLSGLGDAEVGARWFAVDQVDLGAGRRLGLTLSLGTAVPTGQAGARDGAGRRIDDHGQLGAGSWGPTAGAGVRLEQGGWNLVASASGRLRTESRFGYRFGHALLWTAQAQRLVAGWLALGVAVDGRSVARDRAGGAPVANTGGLALAVAPGAHLRLLEGLWVSVRAQLPVLQRLSGDQWLGPTVTAGLAWQSD